MTNGKERTTCRTCNTIRHRARKMGIDAEGLFQHWPPPELCESCHKQPATHIDHDHKTNRFRGWLCNNCNSGLGMFGDDPVRLLDAFTYLTGQHWGDKKELTPDQVYDFKMEYKGA